ncbi:vWA domain-containing protein [Stratiformator vulcanicus]|uniref:von Willebrand factor n=1 Tax=Stratiformator vulcanicus TaxID=2527980 RepID=A0A517R541_9PLAN|nr:VWA domain-containing protein [Stratiformator vulcanicus]QDT38933.1 von Willebrand factor [Stratiformator vulcanicus]
MAETNSNGTTNGDDAQERPAPAARGRRRGWWLGLGVAVIAVGFGVAMLLPAVYQAREASRRSGTEQFDIAFSTAETGQASPAEQVSGESRYRSRSNDLLKSNFEGAPPASPRARQSMLRESPVASRDADEFAVIEDTAFNTESYDNVVENDFRKVTQNPLSTFSIDVDTASYANVRRFLTNNSLPPRGAVRIEEMINYFDYGYEPPTDDKPFAVHVEFAGCPWEREHRLCRIGIKGKEIKNEDRPLTNLVFLLDVSGSMQNPNKLGYVKESMRMLIEKLGENDKVAIVVYASASGLVLPSTTADQREVIQAAIDRLSAGGSTNGGAGIQLAYDTAVANYMEGGVNRVILCTDGDFNVGTTSQSELVDLIEEKAKTGVFLSVLGFGMGNYKDSTMEKLADKGNGNYGYIDSLAEAKKLLVDQLSGTLVTIAKDVKIQVDFNPTQVAAYRLIGYENRMLRAEDFKDDTKDAGEIGAGHTVTALYELIPPGGEIPAGDVEASKYQQPAEVSPAAAASDEALTVRLRYKLPDEDVSTPFEVPAVDAGTEFDKASDDYQFAAAVAQFGLLLRQSKYRGDANLAATLEIAEGASSDDPHGYRKGFLELVRQAMQFGGQLAAR